MLPDPADVQQWLGEPDDGNPPDAYSIHIRYALAVARAYTRGQGWDPDDDLPYEDVVMVCTSAAARSARNPTNARNESTGQVTITPGRFDGFTLPELAVLNRYRKRAA